MDGITCDGCGDGLLIDAEVRYVVKIEVFAAYDPLEITRADLAKDQRAEMARLLAALEKMDPREAEDQVYRKLQFDLCPRCQQRYLKDPLRFSGTGERRGSD